MTERTVNPDFTYINYSVCNYCVHLARAETRDGYNTGCELVINSEGQYARLALGQDEAARLQIRGIDSKDELVGCESFKPSGLPAYPSIKRVLETANPLASAIPEDPLATETSWDFDSKIGKFPHKKVPFIGNYQTGKHSIQ